MPIVASKNSTADGNRRVHFGLALNWEEENRRTERGVALRRERRQRQRALKMAAAAERRDTERRMKQAFVVLLDPDKNDRIVALCRRDITFDTILGLLFNADGVGPHRDDRARRLRAFQIDQHYQTRYANLTNDARNALSVIASYRFFREEFFPSVGGVSDSSHSSEEEFVEELGASVEEESPVPGAAAPANDNEDDVVVEMAGAVADGDGHDIHIEVGQQQQAEEEAPVAAASDADADNDGDEEVPEGPAQDHVVVEEAIVTGHNGVERLRQRKQQPQQEEEEDESVRRVRPRQQESQQLWASCPG